MYLFDLTVNWELISCAFGGKFDINLLGIKEVEYGFDLSRKPVVFISIFNVTLVTYTRYLEFKWRTTTKS